jgi:hypothetical protein
VFSPEELECQVAALRAEIGQAPPGSHPDEHKPRALNWHAERLHWRIEVESLRHENSRLERELQELRNLNDGRCGEVAALRRHNEQAEAALTITRDLLLDTVRKLAFYRVAFRMGELPDNPDNPK